MIDNIVFVRELNSKLKYQTNQNDISFYKTYKTPNGEKDRQIRISSHGTYLKFWVEQDYDPSHGINISIVFTKDGTPTNDCYIDDSTNGTYKDCRPCLSKQEQEGSECKPRRVHNYNQKKRPFSVTQFVYNCQNFEGDEIDALVLAIKNAAQTGNYIGPLSNIEGKRTIKVVLQPINESKQINKTIVNENKMKKVVRLTENDLHRIVKRSVKRIMKESINDNTVREILSELEEEIKWISDNLDRNEYLDNIGIRKIDGMIDKLMELRNFLKDYDADFDGEQYQYHQGPRTKEWTGVPVDNNLSY